MTRRSGHTTRATVACEKDRIEKRIEDTDPMDIGKTTALRRLIQRPGPVVVPFAYDAMSARVIEEAGFEVVGASGSAITASLLALPDIGLATMTEIVTQAKNIAAATRLPLLADADNGYGNHANAQRTVREFERAGVAGMLVEDQTLPKRCGHYEGTKVVSAEEMTGKIRAMIEARRDPDLVIVARTDARQSLGFDEAIDRGNSYAAAGADAIFVEAPRTIDEMREMPRRIKAPLVVNMVEGGRTPLLSSQELGEMGFKIVIWPDTTMAAAAQAMRNALGVLKSQGTTASIMDELMTFEAMRRHLRFAEFEDLDRRHGGAT